MADRLADKVVLISGTAGGMGRVAAQLFAAEGAKVIGGDLDVGEDQETAKLVAAAGGSMESLSPVDLSDREAVYDWVDRAAAIHGRLDVVYNNASRAKMVPFAHMPDDDWHFTIDNELHLVYYSCRAAWKHLEANGGAIINTASTLGTRGIEGLGNAAHAAAKAGVIGLTQQLAVEGGPLGIRVNAVSPSLMDTRASGEMFAMPGVNEAVAEMSPMNQVGTSEDVAQAALFLASDESSFITGANIMVDGGTTIRITNPVAKLFAGGPPEGVQE